MSAEVGDQGVREIIDQVLRGVQTKEIDGLDAAASDVFQPTLNSEDFRSGTPDSGRDGSRLCATTIPALSTHQ